MVTNIPPPSDAVRSTKFPTCGTGWIGNSKRKISNLRPAAAAAIRVSFPFDLFWYSTDGFTFEWIQLVVFIVLWKCHFEKDMERERERERKRDSRLEKLQGKYVSACTCTRDMKLTPYIANRLRLRLFFSSKLQKTSRSSLLFCFSVFRLVPTAAFLLRNQHLPS